MGIVTTSSETAFPYPAEVIYDFVTAPANWTKTYPGGPRIADVPERLPLQVGDTWTEGHPEKDRIFTWQLAIAMRPKMFVFNSVGNLSHDSQGNGGFPGRMTITYHFTQPGEGFTLFTRSMTIEAYRDAPLHDGFFRMVNPAHIDSYHAGIARELAVLHVDNKL
ncbi:MAG: SRPBCC family protein [Mycobacterium sp.]